MKLTLLKFFAAAFVVIAASACTTVGEKGSPSPEPTNTSTAGSTPPVPQRPAELKLNGVDPCKLLTAAHMDEIKVAESKADQMEVGNLGPAPGCRYRNGVQYSYSIILIANKDVREWLDGSAGNITTKLVDVSGYGAAQITFTGVETAGCSIAVDVADGKALYVDYRPTTKKGESQEQQCDNAKKAATLALGTLKTLK